MIVWGGHGDFDLLGYYFNTGGRYDPGTDSWTAPAPPTRRMVNTVTPQYGPATK
jgi:hypothetical protein